MWRTERRAELQREMERLERVIAESRAQLAGAKAEFAALGDDAAAADTELASMGRTDAIVSVLARGMGPMTTAQLIDALKAGGRTEDPPRTVRATLSYLLDQGRVARVSKGSYVAT